MDGDKEAEVVELSQTDEEMIAATLKLRKKVDQVLTIGTTIVRNSNEFPRNGGQFEVYNSYPTYNAFMKAQEERINALMSRLTKEIGCPMRVPQVGSRLQDYSDSFVEAQDNIAERASTLLEVLKNTNRDEVAKVPEYILKAAPTNQKAEAHISSALKTFSSNIGTVLAQKFRERKEEAAQMIVHEKPQKVHNLKVDNSNAPFIPKLKVKHHANEKVKGVVILDDDESGKSDWMGRSEETEEEHPYVGEILNFKVPERQLKSADSQRYNDLKNTQFTMVDSLEKLEELRNVLNKSTEFAVDLEHNSMRSYLGLTCLIQISTRDQDFIVDPFPIWEDVGILNEPFSNPNILKVLHGCDSDVLWLQRDFGIYIVNLFDTYVAMKKLKYAKFSLAYLVSKIAKVVLDKQYQLADWRARPLREAMINYAREDTHYLLYCYDVLREELLEQGDKDLSEVYEECSPLCLKLFKKPVFNPNGYMTEIKVRFSLNSRQDYALTHLYKWRDAIAREHDESPHFVLPNHMMLSLAETLPRDVGGIYACCNPLPYFVKQRTGDIFKILVEARDVKLEKTQATAKEIDDAHESRGIMNDKMDLLTSILRSKIDFSHTNYDEERGEIQIDKSQESSDVSKKQVQESLLSVLLPPKFGDKDHNVTIVDHGSRIDKVLRDKIENELNEWVTPFECYTIVMKEKAKQDAIEEEKRKAQEAENPSKQMFSHNDPTVCRKPVFDDTISNISELKLIACEGDEKDSEEPVETNEEPVFDDSRFSEDQLLSKKALKRKRKTARRNADISTVLGEGPSAEKEKEPEIDQKKRKTDNVEMFDYEKEDIAEFVKDPRTLGNDFDPLHQKFRLKNKSKKQKMKKSSNRQGTINYKK